MGVSKKASSSERQTLLPSNNAKRPRTGHPFMRALHAVLFVTLLVIAWHTLAHSRLSHGRPSTPTPSAPTWPESLRTHCADVAPIASEDYLARQNALADLLHAAGGASYVAEPGASGDFFANLSGRAWGLSERPLLLIVSPNVSSDTVTPKVTILTPTFEETRAKGLALVGEDIDYVSWAEYENPFEVAVGAGVLSASAPVYVDGMTRQFIVAGLQAQGARVEVAPTEIKLLRERKRPAEIEILKCANEATLLAIRAVRERMHIGSRESEVRALIADALTFAGLTGGGGIVLFGENAALPHGSGSDRELGPEDFALIDAGGALHGYVSDVTRTFALQETKLSSRQLDIWNLVHAAQSRGIETAGDGVVAKDVDAAARGVITDAGFGEYFTHRLGHGIGLEVHEAPYLVGGSKDVLRQGHTFSDEPGVYIEGEVGVRLEDCFYVDADGTAVFLTEGTGGQAVDPWHP
ncbi:Creatinase/aminopeptidase [Peniophora sp. CONT]|nr:Creatinase/aminopeptidase [Peniophora sp. CONT]